MFLRSKNSPHKKNEERQRKEMSRVVSRFSQLRARLTSATTASPSSSPSSRGGTFGVPRFATSSSFHARVVVPSFFAPSSVLRGKNASAFDRPFTTSSARLRSATSEKDAEEGGGRGGADAENADGSNASNGEGDGEGMKVGATDAPRKNKRLTRKEKGSYAGMLTEIDSYESHELHGTNLYDTREHIGLEENRDKVLNELLERIEKITSSEEYKERWAQEMAEIEEEKKNGSERILEWETNLVLEAGGTQDHGLNKKVSLKVNVDSLKEETGLSEEAMEYIKAICGKRFLKKTNEIRIVCRRYLDREHNRQWCLRALYELIEEGQKEYPSSGFKRDDIIELNAKRRSELGDSATYVSQN
jgi:hypothetical protein